MRAVIVLRAFCFSLLVVLWGCSSGQSGTTASLVSSTASTGTAVGSTTGAAGTTAGTTSAAASSGSVASTGSGSTAAGTSSSTSGSSTSSSSGGGAIVAPADQWTWVAFPDALCASGTPTGLAVNPHAGATAVLIYLEGGGDCTDSTNCWGPNPTASNLAGYDATTFGSSAPSYPVFNRSLTANPFAAMNMVYVPYCTGDLHSGDAIVALTLPDGGPQPTYFYGAHDLQVFLARLVPTFAPVSRVWLLGTSAGGFGTFMDFDLVAGAFDAGVDIIDDSGPPLVFDGGANNGALLHVWGTVLPSGCASCTSLGQILQYDLTAQQAFTPPGEFGFLSFLEDTTISADFGYSLAQYPALMESFSASLPASPTAATFLVSNYPSHVVESDVALAPDYLPWMTAMVNRSGWADVVYDGGL